MEHAGQTGMNGARAVILSSVHDYRMKRRGSIQAIADAFLRAGHETYFLSLRFSPLSLLKNDPRAFLWPEANRLEVREGINCYLWATPFHPFATRRALGDWLTTPLHHVFANWPNGTIDRIIAKADVLVFESGLSIVMIPRARRLNPKAAIIYYAADALQTIGAHPHLRSVLELVSPEIDHCSLLARRMARDFGWAAEKTYYLPRGVHPPDFANIGPSPYAHSLNAVSVGSMLFDPAFFDAACDAFRDVHFHVIGGRSTLSPRPNLHVYPEMPFREMLPYVAHANFGIAPYRDGVDTAYLAESSLKLTHYDYLRLPAVCPHFAVGTSKRRFGYTPGDANEIRGAIGRALTDPMHALPAETLSWDELLPRLLRPQEFPDTAIAPEYFAPTAPRAQPAKPIAMDPAIRSV